MSRNPFPPEVGAAIIDRLVPDCAADSISQEALIGIGAFGIKSEFVPTDGSDTVGRFPCPIEHCPAQVPAELNDSPSSAMSQYRMLGGDVTVSAVYRQCVRRNGDR